MPAAFTRATFAAISCLISESKARGVHQVLFGAEHAQALLDRGVRQRLRRYRRRSESARFGATFGGKSALIGEAASTAAAKETMLPRAGLSAILILGMVSLASAAQAFDGTCEKEGAQTQDAGRCMATMTVPETVVYGTMSDHGMAVGERYDAQGNPVDRQGDVIAVPADRSGFSQVFAREPAFRQ
jgi:hypothetical protein